MKPFVVCYSFLKVFYCKINFKLAFRIFCAVNILKPGISSGIYSIIFPCVRRIRVSTKRDIYSGICSAADDMEAVLNDFAEAHGQERNITVETGTFPYPASYADDEYYPAGDYRAVRIRIGGGEGRNWWGMIDAGVRGEDRSGIIYYSSIVNWLMALLGWE